MGRINGHGANLKHDCTSSELMCVLSQYHNKSKAQLSLESEKENLPVLDHVIPAFHHQKSRFLDPGLRP